MAYPAVYGGYAFHIGDIRTPDTETPSPSLVRDFRAIVAQQLVQGRAIGWMSPQESYWLNQSQHTSTRRFLAAAATTRVRHANFLVHGRLWRPPVVSLKALSGANALSTCVQDHGFDKKGPKSPPLTCCDVPAVVHAAWITPDGETLGLIAANHLPPELGANASVRVTATVTVPRNWDQRCCMVQPSHVTSVVEDDVVTVTLVLSSGAIEVVSLRQK